MSMKTERGITTHHEALHVRPLARRARSERRVGGRTRPIRTVCAWCSIHDRPAAVLVDVPLDDRGLSHGICPSCRASWRSFGFVARNA
jgi:hypothetical protein